MCGDVWRSLHVILVAAIAVALVVAWRRANVHGVGTALAGANLVLFAIAIALNAVGRTAVRARRTQLLLAGRVTFAEALHMNLAGYAAGALLPGPAEEAVCCAQLARAKRFTVRELAAFQLRDKLVGAASIAVVAAVLLPPLLGGLAIGGIAIASRRAIVPLGWLVVSNALCIAMIGLCIAAAGGCTSTRGCTTVFLATALASAIPLVPAQLGTLEAGFVVAATQLAIPASIAVSAALLYHVAQVAPLVVVGVVPLFRVSAGGTRC